MGNTSSIPFYENYKIIITDLHYIFSTPSLDKKLMVNEAKEFIISDYVTANKRGFGSIIIYKKSKLVHLKITIDIFTNHFNVLCFTNSSFSYKDNRLSTLSPSTSRQVYKTFKEIKSFCETILGKN